MSFVRTLATTVALLAVLAAGLWLGGHPGKLPPPLRDAFVAEAGGLTAEASEVIEDNYFRRVSDTALANASLQGMVRRLRRGYEDRFSEYFSPERLVRFNEEIEGRFSGIGLTVGSVPAGLRVISVFEGSPAERAGLAAGDTIVSVDGREIAGLGANAATDLIKGPEGTEVTIGVRPRGARRLRQVKLVRAQISIPVVEGRIERTGGKRLGYVRFSSFSKGSGGALREEVQRLKRRGAEGLVLDLRGNGGGLLDEAVNAAGVFIAEGDVVVSTDSRAQGRTVFRAEGGRVWGGPLVVMTDGGTASAAEILTAALADDAGAPTVGTESFGKGVFQQEIGLANGGALKLTVGEYFTPDGENLAGDGIDPDVRAADRPRTAADEAVRRALRVLARRAER